MQHPGDVKPPQVAAGGGERRRHRRPRETTDATPALQRPRFRARRWVAAAAVLLMLLGGLGFTEATGVTDLRGTVIRLFSPEGTLVVEIDDPAISVRSTGRTSSSREREPGKSA